MHLKSDLSAACSKAALRFPSSVLATKELETARTTAVAAAPTPMVVAVVAVVVAAVVVVVVTGASASGRTRSGSSKGRPDGPAASEAPFSAYQAWYASISSCSLSASSFSSFLLNVSRFSHQTRCDWPTLPVLHFSQRRAQPEHGVAAAPSFARRRASRTSSLKRSFALPERASTIFRMACSRASLVRSEAAARRWASSRMSATYL